MQAQQRAGCLRNLPLETVVRLPCKEYAMKTTYHIQPLMNGRLVAQRTWMILTLFFLTCGSSPAYQRYKNNGEDPGSNCSACHGDFTSDVSPKGLVFPADNKHEKIGRAHV